MYVVNFRSLKLKLFLVLHVGNYDVAVYAKCIAFSVLLKKISTKSRQYHKSSGDGRKSNGAVRRVYGCVEEPDAQQDVIRVHWTNVSCACSRPSGRRRARIRRELNPRPVRIRVDGVEILSYRKEK